MFRMFVQGGVGVLLIVEVLRQAVLLSWPVFGDYALRNEAGVGVGLAVYAVIFIGIPVIALGARMLLGWRHSVSTATLVSGTIVAALLTGWLFS